VLLCAFFLAVSALLTPCSLYGQSYQAGYKKYTLGDMTGAEAALLKATKTSLSPADKAQTYKLLGIVQYSQGKKRPAAASFKMALASNPALTISGSEVLDSSVIGFFDKIKASFKPTAKRSVRPAATSNSAAVSAPTAPRGGKAPGITRLLVKSNAPSAEIFIDGIIVGNTGNELDIPPGSTVVTLKAKGFKTKTFKMNIKPGRVNQFNLKLVKLAKALPKPKKRLARRQPKAKKSSGGGDLFEDEEPQYRPEPTANSSSDSQSVAPGSALTTDPMAGMQPPPAPAAPAVPALQAAPAAPAAGGSSPVVIVPISPSGGGYAPPPNPYGAYGNPYGAPYGNPYGAYGGYPPPPPPQPAPAAPPPPDYFNSTPKSSGKKSGFGKGKKELSLMTLMPFGLGQFSNGNSMLGTVVAGGQIGALAFWYSNKKDAESAFTEAKQVKASDAFDAEPERRDQYLRQMDSYITKKEEMAQMSLLAFGGLWGFGVVEAYMTATTGIKLLGEEAPLSAPPSQNLMLPVSTYSLLAAAPGDGQYTQISKVQLLCEPTLENPNIAITVDYKF
jgi:hypothetical protein